MVFLVWAFLFGTTNSTFIFVNKDGDQCKENLKRFLDLLHELPEYMQCRSIITEDGKRDKARENATITTNPVNNNQIIVKAKATSKDAAMSLARGLTAPIIYFDEPEFTNYIDIIVNNSVATYKTAAEHARENKALHARVLTCTPGDLDSMAGQQSQKLLDKTTPWSETFYDKGPEYVEEMLKNRGEDSNQIVYIEYQYYQIGLTEEWFKDLAQATADRLTTRREILLQRLHGSSLSPWPQEDIEAIVSAQSKPIKELWLLDYYKFDIYEELDKNIPYIVGVDCATGTNQDNNAITILNPYTVKPAAEFECSFIGETKYEQLLIELCHVLPRAVLCIERNSIGDGIIDHLLYSVVSTRLYFDKSKNLVDSKTTADGTIESALKKEATKKSYYGVYTSPASREDMFSILSDRVATHKEDFVTANITRDISRLVMTKSGKIVAGEDFHDDSVMSYLIAMYVYTHGNNLEVFGIRKGLPTDYVPNQGMKRPEEIDPTLVDPKLIRQAIVQREKERRMDEWDRMMKSAILNSQKESMQLAKAGLAVTDYTTTPDIPVYDFDDGSTDMDFFDELNSMGRFENFSNNNNGNPRGFRF